MCLVQTHGLVVAEARRVVGQVLVWCLLAECARAQSNSCTYANDGECDEPGTWAAGAASGITACNSGTDYSDCNNACRYRNDGECDEPNYCRSGTDCLDCGNCGGRSRPPPPPPPPPPSSRRRSSSYSSYSSYSPPPPPPTPSYSTSEPDAFKRVAMYSGRRLMLTRACALGSGWGRGRR